MLRTVSHPSFKGGGNLKNDKRSASKNLCRFWLIFALLVTCGIAVGHVNAGEDSCTFEELSKLIPNVDTFNPVPLGGELRARCAEGYMPRNPALYATANGYVAGSHGAPDNTLLLADEGSTILLCDAQGKWTVAASTLPRFECVPEGACLDNFDQTLVKIIPLGSSPIQTSSGRYFDDGARVIFTCLKNDGDVRQSIQCQQGRWSPQPPACAIPNCPNNLTLANGYFRAHAANTLEVECDEGYVLAGAPLVHCDAIEERWIPLKSPLWPECKVAPLTVRPQETDDEDGRPPVLRTPRSPYISMHLIIAAVSCVVAVALLLLACVVCHLRRDQLPKRRSNHRLMHNTSHVDELLHLRRTKPIVIPDPISHTQVHYTQDRKPIPVTAL